jgi:hypothetical protein
MSLGDFEICGVVGGSYLQSSGAERSIHSLISDYGNFFIDNREGDALAYELPVARILGIYGHSRVAQESFRSGSSYGDEALTFSSRIADIIKVSDNIFMLYLEVGEGSLAAGTPVYHSLPTID